MVVRNRKGKVASRPRVGGKKFSLQEQINQCEVASICTFGICGRKKTAPKDHILWKKGEASTEIATDRKQAHVPPGRLDNAYSI